MPHKGLSTRTDDYSRLLRIGSLPSESQLDELLAQGYRHLINVYGVALAEIYPRRQWSQFVVSNFVFTDVFSQTEPAEAHNNHGSMQSDVYLARTDNGQRRQFLAAVAALTDCLRRMQPCYVFCHKGQGRSPTLAATALLCAFRLPLTEALTVVQRLRPQARLTSVSIAAMLWSSQQQIG